MVCQVDISEMNGRLNTSDPLDLTDACSTPTPTTIGRLDVATTTVLNAVSAKDDSRSASRSVANRPTTGAAGGATSQQVIIVWNSVTHNSTMAYKQFRYKCEYCARTVIISSPLTVTSSAYY